MSNKVEHGIEAVVSRQVTIPGANPSMDGFALKFGERAAAMGRPIRMRMQPSLFIEGAEDQPGYRAWPGVNWKLEFATAEALIRFREDLQRWQAEWFRVEQETALSTEQAPQ